MRMFFVGLLILLVCLSFDANAQFKPSEQQYLSEENLAVNGGFEQGKKSWTNANGTFSTDTAFKVLGNSSGKVELTAQTLDFSQTLTTGYNASLSGLQGQVSAYAKANFAFEVCALIDGAESNCLQGNSDNSFDFYQIPIVLGATSLGIKFKSIGAVTGSIYVDGVSYGHKQFVQDIAQSELAFDVNIGTASVYVWSSIQTAYIAPTPPDADMVITKASGETQIPCAGTNPSNGLTCSSSAENFGVVFDAKVGEYEICAEFSIYAVSGGYITFQLMETPNDSQSIIQEGKSKITVGSDSNGTSKNANVCGTFYFSTAGKKTIRLMFEKSGAGNISFLTERLAIQGQRDMHITGKYYPPKTKIVTQLQEETVQTANEFSAKISNNGTIISENLDWISGTTCPIVGVNRRCTLNDLGITSPMACVVSAENVDTTQANQIEAEFEAITTTYIDYNMTISGVGNNNIQASIKCQKQGADYNKSRMVYGQFEQIKTTELAYVKAVGNIGGVVSPSQNVNFTEVIDEGNHFNGTVFTVPRDGNYIFEGSFFITSSLATDWFIYINNTAIKRVSTDITAYTAHKFFTIEKLNSGDTVSFRPTGAVTLSNNSAYHYLFITELPDIAAIVKNLNDNKNVKCQTKTLSAHSNSTGIMTDLQFNNLVIGKKYRLTGKFFLGTGANAIFRDAAIPTQTFPQMYNTATDAIHAVGAYIFTANTNTIYPQQLLTNTIYGAAGIYNTWVQLCELPDNWINTTEF